MYVKTFLDLRDFKAGFARVCLLILINKKTKISRLIQIPKRPIQEIKKLSDNKTDGIYYF